MITKNFKTIVIALLILLNIIFIGIYFKMDSDKNLDYKEIELIKSVATDDAKEAESYKEKAKMSAEEAEMYSNQAQADAQEIENYKQQTNR
jgi:regulatory protein YycI of two-component signal transduction system YycFG